jgi:hypothetical protein
VDEELFGIAKTAIGAEYELTAAQAARLHGETASDLRADAKAMRKELGMPSLEDERERDEQGRYRERSAVDSLHAHMNERIRAAVGRTA